MIKKQWISLTLFTLATSLCFGAQNSSGGTSQQQPMQQPNQQPAQQPKMTTPKMDCSQLSPDEQDFAEELSPMQKRMFCSKFDPSMRSSAMEMSGQMGEDGTLITNDQAVEQVAKANNMAMPKSSQTRKSGSCPTK